MPVKPMRVVFWGRNNTVPSLGWKRPAAGKVLSLAILILSSQEEVNWIWWSCQKAISTLKWDPGLRLTWQRALAGRWLLCLPLLLPAPSNAWGLLFPIIPWALGSSKYGKVRQQSYRPSETVQHHHPSCRVSLFYPTILVQVTLTEFLEELRLTWGITSSDNPTVFFTFNCSVSVFIHSLTEWLKELCAFPKWEIMLLPQTSSPNKGKGCQMQAGGLGKINRRCCTGWQQAGLCLRDWF